MLTLLTACGVISDVYDDYDYYEDEVAQSSVRVEQAVPNSLPGPVRHPQLPYIDFSEGSQFDWPSEPPPAAGRPRPRPTTTSRPQHKTASRPQHTAASRPQQQPNHGFEFDDFPPGFPRPDLPDVPDHMRADFDFGARLRPRQPEREREEEEDLFPPPQSVAGPLDSYGDVEKSVQSADRDVTRARG